MKTRRNKIFGALLGVVGAAAMCFGTVAVRAESVTTIYPVYEDLTVGSGMDVSQTDREVAVTKTTGFTLNPAPNGSIIRLQNTTSETSSTTIGSTTVVVGKKDIAFYSASKGELDKYAAQNKIAFKNKGIINENPLVSIYIKSDNGEFLNGVDSQIQGLTLKADKVYILCEYIDSMKSDKLSYVSSGRIRDAIDYENGIVDIHGYTTEELEQLNKYAKFPTHIEGLGVAIYELTPSEIEGSATPYIETSTIDSKWIKASGAKFDMLTREEHPRSITVPDTVTDDVLKTIPDEMTINYYYGGNRVFGGTIQVNKRQISIQDPANDEPTVSNIISTGKITYDTDGDGIDDVVIDSEDFRNLSSLITQVNDKWSKNYKDNDKGLLDNIENTKNDMNDLKKSVEALEKTSK